MKKIEAIIKPFKLANVKAARRNSGWKAWRLRTSRASDARRDPEIYRGSEYAVDFRPKIKVEIVVVQAQGTAAVAAIVTAAKTGKIGAGKVIASAIENAIRIRTEETGERAV